MDDLLLQKYLRNETSEEELVEVLDWLDASTENQRYLDRLDYISNLNILAGEAQPRIRRHTVSLWKRTAQWSAAAAAVLLACAGLGHYMADRILERRTQDMMAITAPNGQSMVRHLERRDDRMAQFGRQVGIPFDLFQKDTPGQDFGRGHVRGGT